MDEHSGYARAFVCLPSSGMFGFEEEHSVRRHFKPSLTGVAAHQVRVPVLWQENRDRYPLQPDDIGPQVT
jgi:hypothetical protein